MDGDTTTTTTVDPETTTTTTQEPEQTTTTTQESKSVAEQYQEGSLPNPDPAHAAPTTDLSASGSVASPDVENPADDPTTNDVSQSPDERLADARATGVRNHVRSQGTSEASNETEV